MIQHRPGNWQQTVDEIEAVHRIDAAIGEIKKASVEDGKNLEDHPKIDERNDHEAVCMLRCIFCDKPVRISATMKTIVLHRGSRPVPMDILTALSMP